jgi:hypothetical protein
LPWKDACLQSRYLVTAVVQLLISRQLPSNRSTCHNIYESFNGAVCTSGYIASNGRAMKSVLRSNRKRSWLNLRPGWSHEYTETLNHDSRSRTDVRSATAWAKLLCNDGVRNGLTTLLTLVLWHVTPYNLVPMFCSNFLPLCFLNAGTCIPKCTVSPGSKALDLKSRGTLFESRSWPLLCWSRVLVVYSAPLWKCKDTALNKLPPFPSGPFKFITHQPPYY